MTDPATLRDSTQIVLPSEALEGFRGNLTEKFTLTLFEINEEAAERTRNRTYVHIIGSPVEIKAASDFLSRQGVTLP